MSLWIATQDYVCSDLSNPLSFYTNVGHLHNTMQRFSTMALTRLVLVVHECDYEFRRDLKTGIITKEVSIIRNGL